jgi:hypothetical protein
MAARRVTERMYLHRNLPAHKPYTPWPIKRSLSFGDVAMVLGAMPRRGNRSISASEASWNTMLTLQVNPTTRDVTIVICLRS